MARVILTPQQRAMSEHQFQSVVVEMARVNGWLVWYQPDWVYRLVAGSMQRRRVARDWPDAGFPDVWLVHPDDGRFLVLECKREGGALREPQRRWLAALQAAGIDARMVRPRDLDDLDDLLARRRGPGRQPS